MPDNAVKTKIDHEDRGHSEIGASGMHRWSKCPGSVRESRNAPVQPESEYAKEGTEAHELANFLLETYFDNEEGGPWQKMLDNLVKSGEVEEEMAEAVSVYVKHIVDNLGENDEVLIEHAFDLSRVYPGLYGTADFVKYVPETRELHVYDYKHGKGITVEVENNPQIQYYALGALLEIEKPVSQVVMAIIQPRSSHADGDIREWRVPASELIAFSADLKEYAEATQREDAPLNPGEWCQFCPASVTCSALESAAVEVAKSEFNPVSGNEYPLDKLGEALALADKVDAWVSSVRSFAYNEAIRGRVAVGFKLVEKRATRKWGEEDEKKIVSTLAKLKDMKLKKTDFYTQKLKSPAQLEKLAPGKRKDKKLTETWEQLIDKFTVKESSGTKLVPESAPGKPVLMGPVDEFKALETEKTDKKEKP